MNPDQESMTEAETGMARKGLSGLLAGKWRLVLAALVLLAALLIPTTLNGYIVYLADLILVYIVVTVGLTISLGWCGLLVFMSAAYFGFGAFAAGVAAVNWGLPVEAAILFGTAMGALLGVVFGALAMRLKGYYLAIATLSLMYMLDYFYRNARSITGGVSGFAVPEAKFLFGVVTSDYAKYYVGLVLAIIAYAVAVWLRKTPLGRSWRVLRKDEEVARALGINVYRSKLAAFTISATLIAFGGTWFVFVTGRFLPETFTINELLFHFLILVVGGLGSLNGAVFSSILLVFAREYLRGFAGVSEILFGAVLLLIVLFLQHGIVGTLARRFPHLREEVV